MKTIFSPLDNWSYKSIWRISVFVVFIFGVIYIAFDGKVALDSFFVIPVAIASWYGSRKSGICLSLVSSALLFFIKIFFSGIEFGNQIIFLYWLPVLISYLFIAILVTNFRKVHRVEVDAADTDFLTGVSNSRSFIVELANELVRSNRYNHIFSLAFLDIDNFKNINDTKGHETGDQLLIEVANCLKSQLRKSDTVARLGGDEFACLLPETEQTSAKQAFLKVSKFLQNRMREKNWPVSFSIGLVTFEKTPDDIKEAIKVADDLMYSVKNKEKDNIAYRVWHGKT